MLLMSPQTVSAVHSLNARLEYLFLACECLAVITLDFITAHDTDFDPFWNMNVHPANFVYELDEGIKIDLCVIIDGYADKILCGLNSKTCSAPGQLISFAEKIGCIDLCIIKSRDIDPGVTRDG